MCPIGSVIVDSYVSFPTPQTLGLLWVFPRVGVRVGGQLRPTHPKTNWEWWHTMFSFMCNHLKERTAEYFVTFEWHFYIYRLRQSLPWCTTTTMFLRKPRVDKSRFKGKVRVSWVMVRWLTSTTSWTRCHLIFHHRFTVLCICNQISLKLTIFPFAKTP